MIVSPLDCFYILMIAVIFGFIIHLETNVKVLLEMMKEHTKCDSIKDSINEE